MKHTDLAIDRAGTVLASVEPVDVALVLGSGLSALADEVETDFTAPFADLPECPGGGEVAGHAGRLVVGRLAGTRVAAFAGRVHRYQGLSAREAAWPVRVAAALGAGTVVVTNAAGGIGSRLTTGGLVLITDHINLTGDSPLVGWPGPAGGNPFVPMSDAYDPRLRAIAADVAGELGIGLAEGVYAAVLGPNYETPAEVRALETLGADMVGMSTVPEVIAARALGMRVLGISLVTNVAAGAHISHDEVLAAGQAATGDLVRLLPAILGHL